MQCRSAQCSHGEVWLVNGSVPNEGRIEVCVDSVWGTVCDMGWGLDDAKVVCRQLRYGLLVDTKNSKLQTHCTAALRKLYSE